MWEANYGKEPFDLRLTLLRMLRQSPVILCLTLAGSLVFGGGYYLKHVLWAEEKYCAESVYHVEYAVEEEKDVGSVYINETTWNTYLHSTEFLEAVAGRCDTGMSSEELAESLSASLASDLRMPSTRVTTADPALSLSVAKAVEAVMTEDFPEATREINEIRVVEAATDAPAAEEDIRTGRAFALSAVLTCFFVVVILLLKELGDDAIYLPASIMRRYGLKTAGTMETPGLEENIRYFFEGKKNIALCTTDGQADPIQILDELGEKCPGLTADKNWTPQPAVELCPESCRELREADGILLAVKAGRHAGKKLEYTYEYLSQQDCPVTAVLLWEADEWLIRRYYAMEKFAGQ